MRSSFRVTRQRDPDDERRVRIAVTAQGRSLRERASQVPATLASGLDLSSIELEALREAVQNMVAVLASYRPPEKDSEE